MRLRAAIGAVLASVVVLVAAGCDSGADSASAPDDRPATTVSETTTDQTTGDTTGTSPDSPSGTTGDTTDPPPAGTTSAPDDATATTPAQPRYALGPTRRCLVRAGMQVGPVGDADARLQALGDLAQRTSLEIRRGGEVVGLAIGNVVLLSELLAVPNDTHRIETQGNALLLSVPVARDLSRRVRDCLRG